MSQQIDTLTPGQSYTLSYYTLVAGMLVMPTDYCTLSTSVGGIVVDTATFTSSSRGSLGVSYSQRSVTVVPTTQSAQLKISWLCVSVIDMYADLVLDDISMVGGGTSCAVSA